MMKSKGLFAVSFMAIMAVSVANAEIASQGYVDEQVATKQDAGDYATNTALGTVRTTATNAASAAATAQSAADAAKKAADAAQNTADDAAAAAATAQSTAAGKLSSISGSTGGTGNVVTSVSASGSTVSATKGITAEETKNKVTSVRAASSATDTAYPSEKAVATALAAKADSADIPTVNNATLTVQKNGSSVGTFTANASQNATINITVPTTTSQLTNNSGFITADDLPEDYVLTAATSTALGGVKSGGDVTVATDGAVTVNSATKATQDGNGATISSTYTKIAQGSGNANKAVITNASGNITTGTITSAMITDGTITNADIAASAGIAASKISGLAEVATSGSYNDLADKPSIPSAYTLPAATSAALGGVKSGGDITVATDGAVTVAHATKADSATSATSATTATTATSATKATQDGNGKVIADTYATKAQITALDSTSSGTGAVVTGVSQTDGKVTVTKGNVQIPVGGESATTYATIWVE